jgi:hypothetical protein
MIHCDLPMAVLDAVGSLFEDYPLNQALGRLVVTTPGPPRLLAKVEKAVGWPTVGPDSPLAAGLWLYVDQLDRSHAVSQRIDDATGSYWHAIMHRLEGDFSNSHYWLRRTGRHPAMDLVDVSGLDVAAYDAGALVDAAEAAHRRGESPADLIELQRREWAALFTWCARQSSC